MGRREVSAFDYAGTIITELKRGVLLTTKAGGEVNTMTIGWGQLGIEWGKPVFTALVRTGRHTTSLLKRNPAFTVNVPFEGRGDAKALGFCGTHTGSKVNKIEEAGLTAVPGEVVDAPAIAQFPLTLECRVLYSQQLDLAALPGDIRESCYPADVDGSATGSNRDPHVLYHAEIVAAYVLE